MDLDKDPSITVEFPESSDKYVTVHLRAGDTSLDWSAQGDSLQQDVSSPGSSTTPDTQGGSAKEEEEEDEGISGQPVTMATSTATLTPTTAEKKKKSPVKNIMSSLWRPLSYLTGSEVEEQGTTQSPVTMMTTGMDPTVSQISSVKKSTASSSPGNFTLHSIHLADDPKRLTRKHSSDNQRRVLSTKIFM